MIQMQAQQNVGGIAGLAVLTPTVHGDDRGYFMETYNQRDMESLGFHYDFVQDNQSGSTYGVLRGLHRQLRYPQTKLVRVVSGTVFDVAVHSSGNRYRSFDSCVIKHTFSSCCL